MFHFTVSTKGCRIREGGALSPSDLFGSEILAKRDFLGSMKDTEIFLGCEKNHSDFFGIDVFHQQAKINKISAIYCWCGIFWGFAKKSRDFFGYSNSEFGIISGRKYKSLSDPPSSKYLSGAPGGRGWSEQLHGAL